MAVFPADLPNAVTGHRERRRLVAVTTVDKVAITVGVRPATVRALGAALVLLPTAAWPACVLIEEPIGDAYAMLEFEQTGRGTGGRCYSAQPPGTPPVIQIDPRIGDGWLTEVCLHELLHARFGGLSEALIQETTARLLAGRA